MAGCERPGLNGGECRAISDELGAKVNRGSVGGSIVAALSVLL